MSACLVLKQRRSVHLLSDCAAYNPDGVLISVTYNKCVAMPTLHAAIAGVGKVNMTDRLAAHLGFMFDTFDALVSEAAIILPVLFQQFAENYYGGDASASVYLIGWSELRSRPEAYAINLWTDGSADAACAMENGHSGDVSRSKLEECDLSGTPIPPPAMLEAARFRVPADLNRMDPARDLLRLMEIQRSEEFEGRHWVGGRATLTTIDRRGISQSVLKVWPDEIGKPITA